MTSKHTPGPWWVQESTGDILTHDRRIASTQQGGLYSVADARLIAAAPELLALVKEGQRVVKLLLDVIDAGNEAQLDGSEWLTFQREAVEAVAKAVGRETGQISRTAAGITPRKPKG